MMIILCGISGSGKSTVGQQLADELGWPFIEGDDFHPIANIRKMRQGIALNDDDRRPWLDALAATFAENAARGQSLIASCSALKRAYRDRLRMADNGMVFIQLSAEPATVYARVQSRKDHFAGVALLESQLAAFEPLAPGEGIIADAADSSAAITAAIRKHLGLF